jgi:L-fuconolactonase
MPHAIRAIDAHQHFWDPNVAEYPWMTGAYEPLRRRYGPADLEPELTAVGVDATILVQARHELDETRRLLEIAEATHWVAGVVGWVDLTAPDVADTIASVREGPGGEHLVGIRHQVHDEPDPDWLLRPGVLRGLAAVADAGLVYELLVRRRELPASHVVGRHLPQLALVVDHLAKPPISSGEIEPWASLLRDLGSLDNVTCKVSGLVTEADWTDWRAGELEPYVRTVFEEFGPERLMFGSDWPVCLLAASYSDVFDVTVGILSDLAGESLESILRGCAMRTYRLHDGRR